MATRLANCNPQPTRLIMVVDDLEVNRKIRCAVLKNAGYRVCEATDGAHALNLAADTIPDLVLSDILMPVMDGFELCRAWKRDPRLLPIPFVFYSATYTEPRDQDFALRLGADAFLRKGVANEEFLEQVAQLLDAPIHHPDKDVRDERVFYREHSERVVRKLEDKLAELERANREIRVRELELQAAKRELEQRVQERTAELVATNAELETFAYTVSHDLRAPLRLINALTHDVLEASSDEPAWTTTVSNMHSVRRATVRMSRLIDELLELSRVTNRVLRRERIDLSALAHEVIAELRPVKAGEASFVIADNLRVIADGELMRVVLSNLFDNAIKYSDREANPRIEFGERQYSGERVFAISDNGVGFESSEAARLFKPFQRLHDTADFDGAGIGLATVARIIHRHGGGVWASGEPGEGATFYFSIPDNDGAVAGDLKRT